MAKKLMILGLVFVFVSISAAFAGNEPYMISFQGKLEGVANPDNVNIEFRLFDDLTAGNQVWTETHSGLDLDNGMFNVLLGNTNALSGVLADASPLWMEVVVDGGDPLAPRQALTAAPFAFSAKNLRGGNAVFENNAADYPSNPPAGMMAYNATKNKMAYYDDTKWVEIDPAYTKQTIKVGYQPTVACNNPPSGVLIFSAPSDKDIVITNVGLSNFTTSYSGGFLRVRLIARGVERATFYRGYDYADPNFTGGDFVCPVPIWVQRQSTVLLEFGYQFQGSWYPGTAQNVFINYIELPL